MMQVWLKTLILSLLAVPSCYLFKYMDLPPDRLLVFASILLVLFTVLAYFLCYRSLPKSAKSDIFIYLFMLFAFTSVIDGLLALTVSGVSNVLDFYLDHGEKYMNTPHGFGLNVWDASAHYIIYILMIKQISMEERGTKSTTAVGLVWAGSILNSLVLMFFAILTGEHALDIQPSILLNVPFVALPILYAIRLKKDRTEHVELMRKKEKKPELETANEHLPILRRILAVVIVVVSAIRTLAVLESPLISWIPDVEPYLAHASAYPRIQVLLIMFAILPMLHINFGSSPVSSENKHFIGGALMQASATMGFGHALFHSFSFTTPASIYGVLVNVAIFVYGVLVAF